VRGKLRGEAAAYAHGEDRPLGSYLVLMATYTTAVVACASAARVAGKSLPARPPIRDLAMVAVATHKIARLISKDPVTSPLRAPFTRFLGTSGDSELEEEVRGTGWRHALGEMVTCPLCLDQWVATFLVAGLVVAPRITRLVAGTFSAVATADLLQHAYARING
jgi:Protein of unknown function (DUF1360)